MNKRLKIFLILLVVGLTIVAGVFILFSKNSQPGKLDDFAKCLGEKKAIFYGAFWCPHCQTQKEMFGKSEKLLPYVECSTPDGKNQLAICQEKQIKGYPTWEFADASREVGEVPLVKLSEKTGCPLPQ